MKNFVKLAETITLVAPYALTSGQGMLVGSIFGIAANDAPISTNVEARLEGEFTLPKLSTEVWTQGVLIYWDNTNKWCTIVSTSNKLIGVATLPASNPSSTGNVRLNNAFIS